MAKEILRKKRSATPMQVKAKKKNSANLMAATKNSVGGIHVYLRSSDNRIKTKIVYNTGLDDRDYEPCNLTASDVTTLYSELNQHFQSLKQGGDSENLRNLIAEEGWYLYNKLVPDEDKAKLSEIHSQYLSEQEAVGDKIIFPPKQILIKAKE